MFDGRGILRGLRGDVLACGCLVGVYERYSGQVIVMIDVVGRACRQSGHASGQFVPLESMDERWVCAASVAAAERSDTMVPSPRPPE